VDAARQLARYNARMGLFDTLGFKWDRDSVPQELPRVSLERVVFRFHRMLPEYVWDAGVLEGNPLTFPEVKTLLEGVAVAGGKLSDQEQILSLGEGFKRLLSLVKKREFKLGKSAFCSLHALVARNGVRESEDFRREGWDGRFATDLATSEREGYGPVTIESSAVRLDQLFSSGVHSLERDLANPFERALAFFLFGALHQFFLKGNKRAASLMMNGVLMMEGLDAVSIPAIRAAEFNSRMTNFYASRDANEMMAFVLDCHPEISLIRQQNPGLPTIEGLPQIKYFRFDDSRFDDSIKNNDRDSPALHA
jgi:hypothetical protein